jgi:hypothetical protein
MTPTRATIGVFIAVTAVAGLAGAQESVPDRVSAETVASVSMYSSWSQPSIMLDGTATVRVSDHAIGLVRPWIMQRPDGSWTSEWYQLQVRYQSDTRIPFRLDAGIIPSPLGLATLEMRADLNPTVSPPFYYFIPLPRFDQTFDALQAMSGGYPFGAVVSTSGAHWDARGGVTSATPSMARAELKRDQAGPMPQLVLGGGVSPMPGLRIGAGFGHGRYRDPRTATLDAQSDYTGSSQQPVASIVFPAADATVTNVEAEYAFGHTRLKGEWVWDRFDTTATPATARAFFVEATHTFAPRWFGAARVTSVDAPPLPDAPSSHVHASTAEAIAGYRITRDLTARGGYYTQRFYNAPSWDHEVCVSLVWARLWR